MKKMNSLLVKGFQASKCKTQLRLGTSRIKLLRNKKLVQIASERREVAELLRNKQDNNARLLVERVIIEQDLIEAYDLLSLYAERIAAQLSVIDSQKTCPPDLKENISTLLYASSRCAELPDFAQIRPMFVAKYGKEFVSAATELRPGCGVNVKVVEKLSSNGATGETKLRLLKEIAVEHNVDWDPAPFEREGRVDRDDVLPGPTVVSGADTSSFLVDDFPSVPNQKPTLGTHVSQPANITNPTSGRFDNVDPTNSPRPRDDRTDSPGVFPRAGPPSRTPPGRDQSRAEDLKFDDGHPDIDSGSREAQSRRNQRRESDSYIAPSPQARHEVQDSRRNSIGVPREKSLRSHAGSARGDVDESLLRDYKKHNQREAGSEDIDEASDGRGSHGREYEAGTDGRPSQKFTAKEVFGRGRSQHEDQYAEEDKFGRTSNRDGSGKGRPQHEDQYPEGDKLGRVSSRDGSSKGGQQYEAQYPEEDKLGRVSSRDGSSKGRRQHEAQYPEEDKLGRVSSRDGSSKGRQQYEDPYPEEDKLGRVSIGDGSSKGRLQHEDAYPEEGKLGRVSSRDGSSKGRQQYEDPYPEEDKLGRVSIGDGSSKGRLQHEDAYPEEGKLGRVSSRDGSSKGRQQYEDPYPEEDKLGRVSNRDGSRKGRQQYEDPYPEEDKLGRVSSRDGSSKGRRQHEAQYPEEDKLGRGSSREGSGDKMLNLETSVEEGSRGRISARVKEDKLYAGKKPKHDYSDEEADHVPHRSEEPRRRESTSNTSKHLDEDPEWDDEHFRNSVTTRVPRNSEDEYRASGKGRDSSNRRTSVEDMSRKFSKLSVPKKEAAKYPNERDTPDTPQFDSSGDEYDSRRSGAKKPEPRYKTTDMRNLDRSSEAGEEGSRKDTRRTSRLSKVDEQRRDTRDDQGSTRGWRPGREDPVNDHFSPSSRTPKDSEKRMSMPGGSGHDKSKHQGNRPHDDYDDSVRRRATLGPEEIRHARARETTDSPKSRFGEREKQGESRRQSAPLSEEDGMEGRQSHRDKTDRQRKVDIPARYDDDRPPRFNPNVSLRDGDEYTPSPRTSRDRSDRQRKAEIPARFDDGGPPPRFLKVGSQPNVDDEDLRGSPALKGDKPQRFVTRNEPRSQTSLQTAKTDPELLGTPKAPTLPEHRKSRSALAESSSPSSKPTFKKPPDLDVLIQMFAPKK